MPRRYQRRRERFRLNLSRAVKALTCCGNVFNAAKKAATAGAVVPHRRSPDRSSGGAAETVQWKLVLAASIALLFAVAFGDSVSLCSRSISSAASAALAVPASRAARMRATAPSSQNIHFSSCSPSAQGWPRRTSDAPGKRRHSIYGPALNLPIRSRITRRCTPPIRTASSRLPPSLISASASSLRMVRILCLRCHTPSCHLPGAPRASVA